MPDGGNIHDLHNIKIFVVVCMYVCVRSEL